jgi:hypothetical protein
MTRVRESVMTFRIYEMSSVNYIEVYIGASAKLRCFGPALNRSHFFFGATTPQWARASSFTRLLDHTQRRTTVGRILLDE